MTHSTRGEGAIAAILGNGGRQVTFGDGKARDFTEDSMSTKFTFRLEDCTEPFVRETAALLKRALLLCVAWDA